MAKDLETLDSESRVLTITSWNRLRFGNFFGVEIQKFELSFNPCSGGAVTPFQGLWDTQNSHFSVATSDSRRVNSLRAKKLRILGIIRRHVETFQGITHKFNFPVFLT